MLAPEKVQEVERLLAEGRLSEREIARRTGVARNTIARIASARQRTEDLSLDGPPVRCPTCGGMVTMPCRRCLIESATAGKPRLSRGRGQDLPCEPLGVNLRGKQRVRYETIRQKKMQAAAESDPENEIPRDGDDDLFAIPLDVLLDAFEFDEEPTP